MADKSYSYMMDTLRKIIRRVEEISSDWWWFEQGNVPVVQVRRLVVERDASFDWTPKVPVIRALKIIYGNFEEMRKLSSERRVEYAIKSAQDLYSVLLAITYIMEAHDLAGKLEKLRERVSRLNPDKVDIVTEELRSFVGKLREALLSNVFQWPKIKDQFIDLVNKLISKMEKIMKSEKVVTRRGIVEETGEGEEVVA